MCNNVNLQLESSVVHHAAIDSKSSHQTCFTVEI